MTTYEFSTDPSRLDTDWIHGILSGTFWARGRTRATMDAAIAASRNYGMYAADSTQVAYARAVTDGVTFAWVADVIVDPAHRRQGLGTQIVDGLMADLESLGLKRVLLKASPEGQELYRRAGFDRLDDPETWLGRRLR
ncbi:MULTISPECIES: GNAT family N-acetyltransferase [unclassified Isoptericola]|uniref:GNAT family N-acetyltransferase n=1 Tax=unclassified Isoptericola TaxID=2623355 RepID=UPI002712E3AB|nr:MULTISPECIES: GNAT family N-acetyltransferase [unclassified Isoptericola]MDO8148811.1 GNAT family N-acetyltransferase [Isoptericola sp. b515]MDO8151248.1 GNAT family N-acetyltransferase [Isoptericola sp. b408]